MEPKVEKREAQGLLEASPRLVGVHAGFPVRLPAPGPRSWGGSVDIVGPPASALFSHSPTPAWSPRREKVGARPRLRLNAFPLPVVEGGSALPPSS